MLVVPPVSFQKPEPLLMFLNEPPLMLSVRLTETAGPGISQ